MKFKFANGHSINIWDSEYDRITVSEGKITFVRPGGKAAVIEVPKEWLVGNSSRPEALSPKDRCCKAATLGSGKIEERIFRAVNEPTFIDAQCGAGKRSENHGELEANYSKLANQVEALRQDLTKFNVETKGLIEPLRKLPAELEKEIASSDIMDKTIFEMIGEIEGRVVLLEKESYKGIEVQHQVKHDWNQPDGPQRRKKGYHK